MSWHTHQKVEQACLGAEVIGFPLEALELWCLTVTGVHGLPSQYVLPGPLIHCVVDGNYFVHVLLIGIPALQPPEFAISISIQNKGIMCTALRQQAEGNCMLQCLSSCLLYGVSCCQNFLPASTILGFRVITYLAFHGIKELLF